MEKNYQNNLRNLYQVWPIFSKLDLFDFEIFKNDIQKRFDAANDKTLINTHLNELLNKANSILIYSDKSIDNTTKKSLSLVPKIPAKRNKGGLKKNPQTAIVYVDEFLRSVIHDGISVKSHAFGIKNYKLNINSHLMILTKNVN